MESALSGITNIRRVRSTSVANLTLVTVQLNWGADLEIARQQVMQKIASVQSSLPVGAQASLESLSNTLGQIQGFVLSGNLSLVDLHDFVDVKLKPLLLQQEGVFEVLVFGGMVKEYAVFVKPAQLQQYDLTLRDVQDALIRNNITSAGGILDFGSQNFAIVAQTQLTDVASIQSAIIAVKNNIAIRVRDVARVSVSHLPYRGGAEQGSTAGVVVEIIKQPEADVVAVSRRVQNFRRRISTFFAERRSHRKILRPIGTRHRFNPRRRRSGFARRRTCRDNFAFVSAKLARRARGVHVHSDVAAERAGFHESARHVGQHHDAQRAGARDGHGDRRRDRRD